MQCLAGCVVAAHQASFWGEELGIVLSWNTVALGRSDGVAAVWLPLRTIVAPHDGHLLGPLVCYIHPGREVLTDSFLGFYNRQSDVSAFSVRIKETLLLGCYYC